MKILLVAGIPAQGKEQHPGGQLTASRLLIDYCLQKNYCIETIDISQSSFPVPPFRRRLLRFFKNFIKIYKYSCDKELKGAIIFAASGFSVIERSIFCGVLRLFGKKTVLMMRSGFFMDEIEASYFRKIIMGVFLKLPSYIVAQGNKWKIFYKNNFNLAEKVVTIYNWSALFDQPTMTSQFNSLAENKSIRFIFVGWMVKEKGILILLEALKRLELNANVQFVFVGGGTLLDTVKQFAEQHKDKNITVTGWLDSSKVNEELKNSDVLILPSYAEGSPNVILEAIAHYVTVIATDVGAVSDTIIDNETGFLIRPRNIDDLMGAITQCIANEPLRKRMASNAFVLAKVQHDWRNNCKQLIELITGEVA